MFSRILKSTRTLVFCKIDILKNLAKITEKHLCFVSSFLIKLYSSWKFIKKRLRHVFSCEFCKNFKNNNFTEYLHATASVLSTQINGEKGMKRINPFQPSVAFHTETIHLIRRANQRTGFFMKCNTGLKRVNWNFNDSKFERGTSSKPLTDGQKIF